MRIQVLSKALVIAAAVAVAGGPATGQPATSAASAGQVTGNWQVLAYDPVIGSGCPTSGWQVALTETGDGDVNGTYSLRCGATPAQGEIVAHRYGEMIRGVWISRSGYGRIEFRLRPGGRIQGQGHRPSTPQTFRWNMARVP